MKVFSKFSEQTDIFWTHLVKERKRYNVVTYRIVNLISCVQMNALLMVRYCIVFGWYTVSLCRQSHVFNWYAASLYCTWCIVLCHHVSGDMSCYVTVL